MKRALSFLLSIMLVFTMMPLSAFAEEGDPPQNGDYPSGVWAEIDLPIVVPQLEEDINSQTQKSFEETWFKGYKFHSFLKEKFKDGLSFSRTSGNYIEASHKSYLRSAFDSGYRRELLSNGKIRYYNDYSGVDYSVIINFQKTYKAPTITFEKLRNYGNYVSEIKEAEVILVPSIPEFDSIGYDYRKGEFSNPSDSSFILWDPEKKPNFRNLKVFAKKGTSFVYISKKEHYSREDFLAVIAYLQEHHPFELKLKEANNKKIPLTVVPFSLESIELDEKDITEDDISFSKDGAFYEAIYPNIYIPYRKLSLLDFDYLTINDYDGNKQKIYKENLVLNSGGYEAGSVCYAQVFDSEGQFLYKRAICMQKGRVYYSNEENKRLWEKKKEDALAAFTQKINDPSKRIVLKEEEDLIFNLTQSGSFSWNKVWSYFNEDKIYFIENREDIEKIKNFTLSLSFHKEGEDPIVVQKPMDLDLFKNHTSSDFLEIKRPFAVRYMKGEDTYKINPYFHKLGHEILLKYQGKNYKYSLIHGPNTLLSGFVLKPEEIYTKSSDNQYDRRGLAFDKKSVNEDEVALSYNQEDILDLREKEYITQIPIYENSSNNDFLRNKKVRFILFKQNGGGFEKVGEQTRTGISSDEKYLNIKTLIMEDDYKFIQETNENVLPEGKYMIQAEEVDEPKRRVAFFVFVDPEKEKEVFRTFKDVDLVKDLLLGKNFDYSDWDSSKNEMSGNWLFKNQSSISSAEIVSEFSYLYKKMHSFSNNDMVSHRFSSKYQEGKEYFYKGNISNDNREPSSEYSRLFNIYAKIIEKKGGIFSARNNYHRGKNTIVDIYDQKEDAVEDSSIIINPIFQEILPEYREDVFAKPSLMLISKTELDAIDFDYMYYKNANGKIDSVTKEFMGERKQTLFGQDYILMNPVRSYFKELSEYDNQKNFTFEFIFVKGNTAKKLTKTLEDPILSIRHPLKFTNADILKKGSYQYYPNTGWKDFYENPLKAKYIDSPYSPNYEYEIFSGRRENRGKMTIFSRNDKFFHLSKEADFEGNEPVIIFRPNTLSRKGDEINPFSNEIDMEDVLKMGFWRDFIIRPEENLRYGKEGYYHVKELQILKKDAEGNFQSVCLEKDVQLYPSLLLRYKNEKERYPGVFYFRISSNGVRYGDEVKVKIKTYKDEEVETEPFIAGKNIYNEDDIPLIKGSFPMGDYGGLSSIEKRIIIELDLENAAGFRFPTDDEAKKYVEIFDEKGKSIDFKFSYIPKEYHSKKISDQKVYLSLDLPKEAKTIRLSRINHNNKINKGSKYNQDPLLGFSYKDKKEASEIILDCLTEKYFKVSLVNIPERRIQVIPTKGRDFYFVVQIYKGIKKENGQYDYFLLKEENSYDLKYLPREDHLMLKIRKNLGNYNDGFDSENLKFKNGEDLQDFYLVDEDLSPSTLDLNKDVVVDLKKRAFDLKSSGLTLGEFFIDSVDIYQKEGGTWNLLRKEVSSKGKNKNPNAFVDFYDSYYSSPHYFYQFEQPLRDGIYKIIYHCGEFSFEEEIDTISMENFLKVKPGYKLPLFKKIEDKIEETDPPFNRGKLYNKAEPYLREIPVEDSMVRFSVGETSFSSDGSYSGGYGNGIFSKTKPSYQYLFEPKEEEILMIAPWYHPSQRMKTYPYKRDTSGYLEEFTGFTNFRDLIFHIPTANLSSERKAVFSVKKYNQYANADHFSKIENKNYYSYLAIKDSEENKFGSEFSIKIPEGKRHIFKDFAAENEILYLGLKTFPIKIDEEGKNKLTDLKIYKKIGEDQQEYQIYDLQTDFYEGESVPTFQDTARSIRLPVIFKNAQEQYKMVYTWDGEVVSFDYGDTKPDEISKSSIDPKNFDLTDLKINPDFTYDFMVDGVKINGSNPIPYPANKIVRITDFGDRDGNIKKMPKEKFYIDNVDALDRIDIQMKDSVRDQLALKKADLDHDMENTMKKEDSYFLKIQLGNPLSASPTKISSNVPVYYSHNKKYGEKRSNYGDCVISEKDFILYPETHTVFSLDWNYKKEDSLEKISNIEISSEKDIYFPLMIERKMTEGSSEKSHRNVVMDQLKLNHLFLSRYEDASFDLKKVEIRSEETSSGPIKIGNPDLTGSQITIHTPNKEVRIFGMLDRSWIDHLKVEKAKILHIGLNMRNADISANKIDLYSKRIEDSVISAYNQSWLIGTEEKLQKGYIKLGKSGWMGMKNSQVHSKLLNFDIGGSSYDVANTLVLDHSSIFAEEIRYGGISKVISKNAFVYLERDKNGNYTPEEIQDFDYFEKIALFRYTEEDFFEGSDKHPKDGVNAKEGFLYRIPTTYTNLSIEGYPYDFADAPSFNGNYNIVVPLKGRKVLHYTENGEAKEKLITPDLGYDINNLTILKIIGANENTVPEELSLKYDINPKLRNPYQKGEDISEIANRIRENADQFTVFVADINSPIEYGAYQVTKKPLSEILNAGIELEYNDGARILRLKNPNGNTYDTFLKDDITERFDYNYIKDIFPLMLNSNPLVPMENPMEDFKNYRLRIEDKPGNVIEVPFQTFLDRVQFQAGLAGAEYGQYIGNVSYSFDDVKRIMTVKIVYPYLQEDGKSEVASSFEIPLLVKSNVFDSRYIPYLDFLKDGEYKKDIILETVPPENLTNRTDFKIRATDINGNTWEGTVAGLKDFIRQQTEGVGDTVGFFRIPNKEANFGIKENSDIVPQGKSYFALYVATIPNFSPRIDYEIQSTGRGIYGYLPKGGDSYEKIWMNDKVTITSIPESVIPNNEFIRSVSVKNPSMLTFLSFKDEVTEEQKNEAVLKEEYLNFKDLTFDIIDNYNIVAENVDYQFLKAREISLSFDKKKNKVYFKNKKGKKVSKDYVYLVRNAGFQGNAISSFKILDWQKVYNQGDPINTDAFRFEVKDIFGVMYEKEGRQYMTYDEAKENLMNFRIVPTPGADGDSLQPENNRIEVLFNYYQHDQEDPANFNFEALITVNPVEFDKTKLAGMRLIRRPFILMGAISDKTPMNFAGMILEMEDSRGAKKEIRFNNTNPNQLFEEYQITPSKQQGELILAADGANQTIEIVSDIDSSIRVLSSSGKKVVEDTIESIKLIKPPTFQGPYIMGVEASSVSLMFEGMEVDVKLVGDDQIYRFKNDSFIEAFENKINTPKSVTWEQSIKEILPKGNINDIEVYRTVKWIPIGKKDDVIDYGSPLMADVKKNGFNQFGFRVILDEDQEEDSTRPTEEHFFEEFKTNPILLANKILKKVFMSGLGKWDLLTTFIEKKLPENADKIKYINTDNMGNREIVYEDGTRIKIPIEVINGAVARVDVSDITLKLGEQKDVLMVLMPTKTHNDYEITLLREETDGNVTVEKIDPSTLTKEEGAFGNQKIRLFGTKIGELQMKVAIKNNPHPDARKVVKVTVLPPDQAIIADAQQVLRGLAKDIAFANPQNLDLALLRKNKSTLENVGFTVKDEQTMTLLADKGKEPGEYTMGFVNEEHTPPYGDFKDFSLEVLKGQIFGEDMLVDLDADGAGKTQTLTVSAINHEGNITSFALPEAMGASHLLFQKEGLLANKKVFENEFFKATLENGVMTVIPKKVSDDYIEVPLQLDATSTFADSEILEKVIRVKVKQDKIQQDITLSDIRMIRGNTKDLTFPTIHDRLTDEMEAFRLQEDTLNPISQLLFKEGEVQKLRFQISNNTPLNDYTIQNNKDAINSASNILNVSDFNVKVLAYTLAKKEMIVYKNTKKKEILKAVLEDKDGNMIYSEEDKASYTKTYDLLNEHDIAVNEIVHEDFKITKENNLLHIEGFKPGNHTFRVRITATGEAGTAAADAEPVTIQEIVTVSLRIEGGLSTGEEYSMNVENRLLGGEENAFLKTFDHKVTFRVTEDEQYHLPVETKDRVNGEEKYYLYKVTIFEDGKPEHILLERSGSNALAQEMLHHYVEKGGRVLLEYREAKDILDTGTMGTVIFFLFGGSILGAGIYLKKRKSKVSVSEKKEE